MNDEMSGAAEAAWHNVERAVEGGDANALIMALMSARAHHRTVVAMLAEEREARDVAEVCAATWRQRYEAKAKEARR